MSLRPNKWIKYEIKKDRWSSFTLFEKNRVFMKPFLTVRYRWVNIQIYSCTALKLIKWLRKIWCRFKIKSKKLKEYFGRVQKKKRKQRWLALFSPFKCCPVLQYASGDWEVKKRYRPSNPTASHTHTGRVHTLTAAVPHSGSVFIGEFTVLFAVSRKSAFSNWKWVRQKLENILLHR